MAIQAQAENLKFFCFQTNLSFNQIFESGFTDCSEKNERTATNLKKRSKVCVESGFCVADSPEFRENIESMSKGKNFAALNSREIGILLQEYDKANGTKTAHESVLICQATEEGDCPHPTRCQEDILFNMKSVAVPGVWSYTDYPKKLIRTSK